MCTSLQPNDIYMCDYMYFLSFFSVSLNFICNSLSNCTWTIWCTLAYWFVAKWMNEKRFSLRNIVNVKYYKIYCDLMCRRIEKKEIRSRDQVINHMQNPLTNENTLHFRFCCIYKLINIGLEITACLEICMNLLRTCTYIFDGIDVNNNRSSKNPTHSFLVNWHLEFNHVLFRKKIFFSFRGIFHFIIESMKLTHSSAR